MRSTPGGRAARAGAGAVGTKRKAHDTFEHGDDEAWDWNLTRAEEERLAEAVEAAIPQTPQKSPRSNDVLSAGVYATPTSAPKRRPRKLPWLHEPSEPVTPRKRIHDYFRTPPVQPRRPPTPDESPAQQQPSSHTEPLSPSPTARFDAFSRATTDPDPDPDPDHDHDHDPPSLTDEVLDELGPRLAPETRTRLTAILRKHQARAEGLKKGRDVSRAALRAKERQLRELQARVAGLEAVATAVRRGQGC